MSTKNHVKSVAVALIATSMLCWGQASAYATLRQDLNQVYKDVQSLEQKRIDVIKKASRAAVSVFAANGKGGGSGVVVTPDGYALTNFHVVQGNGPFMKCSMPDGVLYDCVIVGIDPTGDVALIKLFGDDDFPTAVLGDSDLLAVGQYCFAVGNPFLLATDFQPSVSWGIVSGIHRYQYPAGTILEYADCIQTDAAINPGNSGGPLFNSTGELVGINGRGSFEKRGRVNVGVGYAISINQIKLFLDHLRSGRLVDHASLGATVVTNERGEVRVGDILESSAAYRRGLRFDDEIISFAGREIRTVNQFKNVLGIYPKGWRVPLEFKRGEEAFRIYVRLAGVHAVRELTDMIQGTVESDRDQPGAEKQPIAPRPKTIEKPAQEKSRFAEFFESRRGFANYYFNLKNRNRVWDAFLQHGDFSVVRQKWRLSVEIDGAPATMVLGDLYSGLQLADDAFIIDSEQSLADQIVPANAGGYVTAFHLWRRMLTVGPSQYGDVYYLGSLPVLEMKTNETGSVDHPANDTKKASFQSVSRGQSDVLVATFDVIESRFMFDQQSHQLSAMEMYADIGGDPCELQFSDYQVHGDLTVPRKIRIVYGDRIIKNMEILKIEFISGGTNSAGSLRK